MSLYVINPFNIPSESTTGSFSIRCFCKIDLACSKVVPTGTVIRLSFVITLLMCKFKFGSNLKSRFVRIPINLWLSSIIGIPDILYLDIKSIASLTNLSLDNTIGSDIIPLSDLLTLSTSSACLSIVMFL